MSVRVSRGLGLAALFAGLLLASVPDVGISAEPTDTDSSVFAKATALREALGFQSDPSFVWSTLLDPVRFPNTDWGVPMSDAEAVELHRRELTQSAMEPATGYAGVQAGYAGVYIDHQNGGIPVYLFTGDAELHRAAIRARLPDSTEFDLRSVERSYSDLQELRERVELARGDLAALGIAVHLTGIQPSSNSVVVGVEMLTPAGPGILQARFGPGLSLREQGPGVPDACNSMYDCWPPKGGIEVKSSATGNKCTSGWVAKRTDTFALVLVTAGHCIEIGGGENTVWTHKTNSIGKAQKETWASGADGDVGLIGIYASSTPTTKNRLIAAMPNGVYSVTSVRTSYWQHQGDVVCRVGRTTGLSCGTITVEDVTNDSCVGSTCRAIDHTWEVNFDSTGGDSGGPIYSSRIDGTKVALGTHVHSDPDGTPGAHGWYTPIDWGQWAYNQLFGISYSICVTSSC